MVALSRLKPGSTNRTRSSRIIDAFSMIRDRVKGAGILSLFVPASRPRCRWTSHEEDRPPFCSDRSRIAACSAGGSDDPAAIIAPFSGTVASNRVLTAAIENSQTGLLNDSPAQNALATSLAVLRLSSNLNSWGRLRFRGRVVTAPNFSASTPLDGEMPTMKITTPHNFVRENLIVIGFVAAAPIAIGGWLWLLGWIALTIFVS